MFDYSLKFTTTDVSMVGDYAVLINVKIRDRPSPPYASVTPPLQLKIPVSVRNCSIVPDPATPTNMDVKVGKPLTTKPLTFAVTGQSCGAATVTFVVIKGTTVVSFPILTYEQTTGFIKVINPEAADIGIKTVKFTVSLADVPIPALSYTFNLTISEFK
jgi:hypothetical protein